MPNLPLHSKVLTCPDGIRVFAEARGDPSKHPVVFVHGLALTGAAFDRQFDDPRLNENFFLVRYDMRGHGRSGLPFEFEAYSSIRYAEEFKTVCEGFGIQKPSVVAWSLGACVIVDVVDAWGISSFSNIIYCGGPVLVRHYHDQCMHPHVLSLMPDLMSTDGDVVALTGPKYVDSIFHDVDRKFSYPEQQQFIGAYSTQPPTIRAHSLMRTHNSERWEKEIKEREVLLLQGRHDRHARADAMLEMAKKYLGKCEVHVFEDAGHAPGVENADEVNGYIVEFLQRKLRE